MEKTANFPAKFLHYYKIVIISLKKNKAILMCNTFKPILVLLFYMVSFLFLIASCSKDPVIPPPNINPSPRKVLIEVFTGHYDGHGVIVSDTFQNIQKRHPDKVIGITIHSGYFAKTFPPPFNTDLRCTEGDVFYNFVGVTFNPTGTVNRVGYPDNVLKSYTHDWTRLTDSMLSLPAYATLKIVNQYNSTTRILNSSVKCNFSGALKGFYKLVVLLTEDSVIAPQKDYNLPDPHIAFQYIHRNILRDGITTPWGDLLNCGFVTEGDSMIKSYSYILPAKFNAVAPNENHCRVIAYVYDTRTYEVLQAEEMKMK
jgi:hypothetical protein